MEHPKKKKCTPFNDNFNQNGATIYYKKIQKDLEV